MHWIEYERGSVRTVKHAKLPISSFDQPVSEMRSMPWKVHKWLQPSEAKDIFGLVSHCKGEKHLVRHWACKQRNSTANPPAALSLSPIIHVDAQKHKIHNVFHLLWNIWKKTKLSKSRSNILLSSSPSPSTGELRKSVKHPWSYNPPHRSWYHHQHHHCPNHFRKTNIMRADHVVLEERLSIKNINTQVAKIYLVLSSSRL